MATGIGAVIIFAMFYFLKKMYQKLILKKSNNEILLEELQEEYSEFCSKLNIFKSKRRIEKERKDYLDEISLLEKRIQEENNN